MGNPYAERPVRSHSTAIPLLVAQHSQPYAGHESVTYLKTR
ncbi:MAG: hypothetical protein ACI9OJ_000514 [Myxococcota bacterium]|jgi:hypothetical protein